MKTPFRITLLILIATLSLGASAVTPWQAGAVAEAVSQGNWESMERLYRELRSQELDSHQQFQVDYNLGVALYEQGKFKESLELFDSVAKSAQDESLKTKALYGKGNSHFKLQEMDKARAAYEEVLLLDSNDDDARYNIEQILDQQEKKDQDQSEDKQKEDQQEQEDQQKDQDKNKESAKDEKEPEDQRPDQNGSGEDKQNKDGKSEQPREQKPEPTEAEKRAAQKEAQRAQLLEYFKQQERDGRPATVVQPQAPPMRGKTW